jgi:hypothetical protein
LAAQDGHPSGGKTSLSRSPERWRLGQLTHAAAAAFSRFLRATGKASVGLTAPRLALVMPRTVKCLQENSIMLHPYRKLTVLLGGIVLLGACSTGEASRSIPHEAVATAPQEVVVTARDFDFDAPETIYSGLTVFRLINEGPDLHHLQLVRLEDGHTLEDLGKAMASHDAPPPSWVTMIGGPNTPGIPGEETNATLYLEPGNYVMLCLIPAADGEPHTMKGMVKPLTVLPSDEAPATLPAADLTMVLDDYSFDTDRPITAGRRTIRVANVAVQPHEVVFVQLAPGRSATDFLFFMQKPEGVPPGKIVGGTTAIANGGVNQVTIDFAPGEYALLCFIPDAKDGAPHIAHGMARQITVR